MNGVDEEREVVGTTLQRQFFRGDIFPSWARISVSGAQNCSRNARHSCVIQQREIRWPRQTRIVPRKPGITIPRRISFYEGSAIARLYQKFERQSATSNLHIPGEQ